MNTKLLLKVVVLVAMLLLLVLMGMNNRQTVALSLPPLTPKLLKLPAALMYIGFFGLGLLGGTLLTGGKKGGSAGKSKPSK